MRYIRTIVWLIYFFAYLLCVMTKTRKLKKLTAEGKLAERDEILNPTVYKWASRLMRLAGVKTFVKGQENIPTDTPVLFVSNHQSFYDIPVLITALDKPHGFIAKTGTEKIPMIYTWMEFLNCVLIDRENPREAVKALNAAAEKIKSGYSMIIFPEGKRSMCDDVNEFKSGAFKIAQKTGVPIVPVKIDGAYKAMEANNLWMTPADVHVTILPPVYTNSLSREDRKALPEKIRQDIIDA